MTKTTHASPKFDKWRHQKRDTLVAKLAKFVSSSLLLGVLVTGVASANPKLFQDAQQQLAQGNPKQAYMLLVAEQKSLAGNVEFDYLLGVAALDSGKVDEAIIALERVLSSNPKNAGAQLDLGRAYFAAGSLDLAEGTFKQLALNNPPDAAKDAIKRYLAAIAERRNQGKRKGSAWGEVSIGYDTNLTGVPADFTSAVASSFALVGIEPTGNSIKRKAPFLGAAVGGDLNLPFNANWGAIVGGELRGRAYRKESDFNQLLAEIRGGVVYTKDAHQIRLLGTGSRFNQDAQAPGDPKPTNDRNAGTLGAEYRYAPDPNQQLSVGLFGGVTRFPKNNIEDVKSTIVTAGWTRAIEAKGTPIVQVSVFFSDDKAYRTLIDDVADKSKRIAGLRGYAQYNFTEKFAIFTSTGFTQRSDKTAFARATEVEFGRDKLFDLTLGLNWRFQPSCNLRAQWMYSRNTSNIAIYEYARNEISSNIRCDFL